MVLVFGLILFGFLLGVVAVVAAEVLGVLLILKRLSTKIKRDEAKISSKSQLGGEQDPLQSLNFAFKKQGVVWVLESHKIPKTRQDKPLREQKRKRELLEVSPVKKYGKIKGQSLILTEPDGLSTTIQLKGCIVEAVSATSLYSKKWAKRFPIKVENKTTVIYNGRKTFYLYLETSWEKEAWCKALRLAAYDDKEKIQWFTQLHVEFHSYLTSLNAEYHSFMKPAVGFSVEAINRATKPDNASSKVRQFLKRIAKKTSRVGMDNRSSWTSLSFHEERKNTEKLRASQDAVLATELMKTASQAKRLKNSMEDNAPLLSSTLSHSGSQSHMSVNSDADSDEKFGIDEGTLSWNLLISRLFFDVKGNAQLKKSMQAIIQRTLSNMRIPSYVGEVICTDINTGNIPPCIIGMRVLPMEMNEVCALEVDSEYSGGALLEIETRLEIRELDLQKGRENENPETSNISDVSSDLLEGFEYIGKQLNPAEGKNDLQEQKEEGDWNTDVSKSFKSTTSSATSGSRWKSMLNSVSKQVSRVPLSLVIRVASLRGTLRLHIKPPPSDQLWCGFSSMPDIDFNLESSVGEHKITSGRIALFLVNRLKAAIRETVVLPNCQSICIPWMLAEKDDWVSRNVAPFIWVNRESGSETSTSLDTPDQPPVGVKARLEASAKISSDGPEHELQKSKSMESCQEPARKSSDSPAPPLSSTSTLSSSRSFEELRTPLLEIDKREETRDLKELRTLSLQNHKPKETTEQKMENNSVCQSPPKNVVLSEKQNYSIEQDDGRTKKIGRRERMLDLRKKMSVKFDEKRRHIEEKGRHIVEKMRGP